MPTIPTAGTLWLWILLLVASATITRAAEPPSAAQQPPAAPGNAPVILLTGFEPFGPGRPANASWEGVRRLDGTEWRGFKLVSKQLPVVWGAPLVELEKWIGEYRPVAVLAFGQGGPAFTVESQASNRRGTIRDNAGQTPSDPRIAADGPDTYSATAACAAIVQGLSARGYPIRLSTAAGGYLCEECLYTLEHLKAAGRGPQQVLFCHVPPLGRQVADRTVDAEYVEQFVRDLLETWHANSPPPSDARQVKTSQNAETPASDNAKPSGNDAERKQIQAFIDRYFDTWSKQDMRGYDDCFLPAATIQFIDAEGRVTTRGKGEFLATQIAYQGNTKNPADERAVRVDIQFEARLARALVYWKLTAGPRVEYGYDHFTLLKDNGRWKILHLVFYSAAPPK